MKKKIISLCLVVVLALTAIGGATLAYFTDTDEATNTFTAGNVKIELIEQQRGEIDGDNGEKVTGLVDFVDGKMLYPVVGSAQGPKDEYGLPTAENYVDKIVTVKNLAQDAYVRVYIAVPAALENKNASKNILHWNWGNKFTAAGDYAQAGQSDGQTESVDYLANMGSKVQLDGITSIDGIDYNVYYWTYKKALIKDEVTGSAFLIGMYLDQNVDYVHVDSQDTEGESNENGYYTINGNKIDFDLTNVKIPVFAIGVQSAGFEDVKDETTGDVTKYAADVAIEAAFGANYNPWATTTTP